MHLDHGRDLCVSLCMSECFYVCVSVSICMSDWDFVESIHIRRYIICTSYMCVSVLDS